jgi:hypothetical protein
VTLLALRSSFAHHLTHCGRGETTARGRIRKHGAALDHGGSGRSQCRQRDREFGDVATSKAVVRVDGDRWLLMGDGTSAATPPWWWPTSRSRRPAGARRSWKQASGRRRQTRLSPRAGRGLAACRMVRMPRRLSPALTDSSTRLELRCGGPSETDTITWSQPAFAS